MFPNLAVTKQTVGASEEVLYALSSFIMSLLCTYVENGLYSELQKNILYPEVIQNLSKREFLFRLLTVSVPVVLQIVVILLSHSLHRLKHVHTFKSGLT